MDDWTARERVLVALLGVAVFVIMCLAAALANLCSSELRDAVPSAAHVRRVASPPPWCDPDERVLLQQSDVLGVAV
jgi:hypothetical protein